MFELTEGGAKDMSPATAVAPTKPDLKDVPLPYVLERCLLMTTGHWNGADFPPSSIAPAAKKLAADKTATVRLFRGATTDHQDSTGTIIGHTENHEWDGKTLWGDCVFIDEDAARVAMYQKETKLKLEGISPRMTTQPPWKPANGKVEKILEFKSFGIVLDPAQGEQAMLSKDSEGRTLLDDGPYEIVMDAEPGQGQGVGKPRQQQGGREWCYCEKCDKLVKHERGVPCVEMECPDCGQALIPAPTEKLKGVSDLKKLFCEKCELLFDEGTEKCSKCQGELKEADEATVARLQEKAKKEEEAKKKEAEAAEKKQKEEEAKAKKEAEEKEKAEAQRQKEKEYPAPTYKERPYYGSPYGYKRPYYGKPAGAFHKEAQPIRSHVFSRKPALDQVADLEELKLDFVGFCGAVLKAFHEEKLDLGEAILEITAMLREVPQSAELSKDEVELDEAVLALVKENEELKQKEFDAEVELICGKDKEGKPSGKLAPAVREDVEALLSVPSDAILSMEGETIDVASRFRKIVESLPDGATLTLDEKTKKLVGSESKLSKDEKTVEEKREQGASMVPKGMRKTETK